VKYHSEPGSFFKKNDKKEVIRSFQLERKEIYAIIGQGESNGEIPEELTKKEIRIKFRRSKKMRKLTLMIILTALSVIPAMGDYIAIQDGGTHVIGDDRYKDDHIRLDRDIANDPGTSFTLITDGIIGGDFATLNTSIGDVAGGSIGGDVRGNHNSTVNISDGIVNGHVSAWNSSVINISGGTIGGDIIAKGASTIKMTGGEFTGIFDVWADGVIELYGSGFRVDGVDLSVGDSLRDFGTLELLGFGDPFYTGTITGTLSDGTELNNYFQISDWEDGDIIIVPEPATFTIFITGLGAMVIRKRRHN